MATKQPGEPLKTAIRRARSVARAADRSEPRAESARYDRRSGRIEIELRDGCLFAVPVALVEGLRGAAPQLLEEVEVIGGGYALRWEKLDADLTVPGLLSGRFGSKRWMAQALGRAGGSVRSEAKSEAARANGRKGGRPTRL